MRRKGLGLFSWEKVEIRPSDQLLHYRAATGLNRRLVGGHEAAASVLDENVLRQGIDDVKAALTLVAGVNEEGRRVSARGRSVASSAPVFDYPLLRPAPRRPLAEIEQYT